MGMSETTTIMVMAKECLPGRVKTRLHPPLTLADAARVAAASLADTLDAAEASGLPVVVCAQGDVPVRAGMRSIPQVDGGLDERIAAAVEECAGRVLLIGMDTPQVDPLLLRSFAEEWPDDIDGWFGPADDGGFWLLGLDDLSPCRLGGRSRGDLVRGVPMSSVETGARQRERLADAWLRVTDAPPLTDIDDIESLRAVSDSLPRGGHLATLLVELGIDRRGGAS
ncbi:MULTISPECIES: DUF2064 domain-containing protein [unclassified Microbacterium]|uniref:TIGR04282 family arsenosugar biosynthesis glycosyltransferase n=1 Tax=unclassified Microbacterium TaxID=2609290 RepID=UPI000EA9459F|nr:MULTISPECIES: DUF2064 domain-containing protein [unclassified Microbacterium]MBT2483754.1 DUF2064 domain-containing protein [Microbacterium sp. ISL-108]RKN66745.1 DUF2064 domain-containing protein [Microbacterium sp. CGR2]